MPLKKPPRRAAGPYDMVNVNRLRRVSHDVIQRIRDNGVIRGQQKPARRTADNSFRTKDDSPHRLGYENGLNEPPRCLLGGSFSSMDVRDGHMASHRSSSLSTPITAMSRGTSKPADCAASNTSRARPSWAARTAVGRGSFFRKRSSRLLSGPPCSPRVQSYNAQSKPCSCNRA